MIWFMSDPHYAHKNIIRGCSDWDNKSGCRDFDTFTAHNDWIVDTLNEKVEKDDVLWCLGDWSFGGEDRISEFRYRLQCQTIHMILGNHDHHIAKDHLKYGFASVSHYQELQIDGLRLVLCHYPIESWNYMERGAIHLHGHTHGKCRKIPGRYEVSPETCWITSLQEIKSWKKADKGRHATIEGGNKFGGGS